jgi:hypothetical protein
MSRLIDIAAICGLAYAVFVVVAALVLWGLRTPLNRSPAQSVSTNTEMLSLATKQAAPCCTA